MDEESFRLTPEGAIDVARWAATALESGHFDWNLLCGGNEESNIAERWRMVRWLNDMKLLDGPLCESDLDGADDKEMCAAIMLSFLFANVEKLAGQLSVTPAEVMAST